MKIEKVFDVELNDTILSFQPVGMAKEYHLYKDGVYYKTIPQAKNLFPYSDQIDAYGVVGSQIFGLDFIPNFELNSNIRYSCGIFFKEFGDIIIDAYNLSLRRITVVTTYEYYTQVPNPSSARLRSCNQTTSNRINYIKKGDGSQYEVFGNTIYNGFQIYGQPAYNHQLLDNAKPYQLFLGERISFELKERGTYTIKTIPLEDSNREESDFTEAVYFAGGMRVTFYKNKAEPHRVDKREYLEEYASFSIKLKDACSITNPSLILKISTFPNFNYCYIPIFNRYYFVENVVSVKDGVWEITLKCDFLMSYREEILNQEGFVLRNEFEWNNFLVDDIVPSTNKIIRNVVEYDKFKTVVYRNKLYYNAVINNTVSYETLFEEGNARSHTWEFNRAHYISCVISSENFSDYLAYNPSFMDSPNLTHLQQVWYFENYNYFQDYLNSLLYKDFFEGIEDKFKSSFGSMFSEPSEFILRNAITPLDLEACYVDLKLDGNVTDQINLKSSKTFKLGKNMTISLSGSSSRAWIIGYDTSLRMFSKIKMEVEYDSFIKTSPITNYWLYLPFIGVVKLNSERIERGLYKYIVYDVDCVTGEFVAWLSDIEPYIDEVYNRGLDTWSGSLYTNIALGSSNKAQIERNQILAVGGAIKSGASAGIQIGQGVSMLGGAMGGVAGVATGIAFGVGSAIVESGVGLGKVAVTTPLEVNAHMLSDNILNFKQNPQPILFISYPDYYYPPNYNHLYGKPLMTTKKLEEVHGYSRIGEIHLEGLDALDDELSEIYNLLSQGVILP